MTKGRSLHKIICLSEVLKLIIFSRRSREKIVSFKTNEGRLFSVTTVPEVTKVDLFNVTNPKMIILTHFRCTFLYEILQI